MARLYIDKITTIGNDKPLTAVDWYIYESISPDGPAGALLASAENTQNFESISLTMKYPDGRLYPPELPSAAFARLHYLDSESELYLIGQCGLPILPQRLPYDLK